MKALRRTLRIGEPHPIGVERRARVARSGCLVSVWGERTPAPRGELHAQRPLAGTSFQPSLPASFLGPTSSKHSCSQA